MSGGAVLTDAQMAPLTATASFPRERESISIERLPLRPSRERG